MVADMRNSCNKLLNTGFFALSLALGASASAKDLGVQGKIWDITEIDMRILVMQSAMRADFNSINNQRKDAAATYMDRLPKRAMALPERTETRWIDPSIEVENDLQSVDTDATTKDYKWVTLFKKGTRVNPLKVIKPVKALFFFDGTSEEQVEFAKQILREDQYGRVVLIEATGNNIKELTKAMGRPVFYLTDAMVRRFNINQAPSLLYAASGDYDGLLGLTSFAKPFDMAALRATWEIDITKARGPIQGAKNAKNP